jgi:nucleoside-diphosphate-sugar epimerase
VVGPRRVTIIGCGWLGTRLGDRLRRGGTEVHATTTCDEKLEVLRFLGFTPHRVELGRGDGLAAALEGSEAAVVCAAPGRGGSYEEVYGRGMEDLARRMEESGVPRLLYTGSTGVYAQEDGSWVDEDSPADPAAERGRLLLRAEEMLRGIGGVATTVLRLAGLWGPGRDPADWAARWAGTERRDGESWLNLIHGEDVVRVLEDLLAREHRGVLCLADGRPHRRRELFEVVRSVRGLDPVRWVPGGGRGRRISGRRALALTGLALRHPRYVPSA